MQNDWVIGVVLSVLSSLMSCLGLIFQKKAHMQNEALPEGKKWPIVAGIVCSPCWWASFALMGLIPFPFDFFAYSFAAQSLIAPFAAVTLIMNQFFAPLILKEHLYQSDIYASVIVFTGTIITTLSGNHEEKSYDLDAILPLFKSTPFVVCSVILFVMVLAMIYSVNVTEDPAPEGSPKGVHPNGSTHPSAGVHAAKQGTNQNDATTNQEASNADDVAIDLSQQERETSETIKKKAADDTPMSRVQKCFTFLKQLNVAARPLYYGFIAGAFGGMQNVFFKGVGVLMKSSVFDGGKSAWGTPYPYVFLLVVIVLALCQLSFLNKGMARFDAVLVFPLYNACYIFLSVSLGALFYGEFDSFDATQWTLFPLGVCITLVGILILIRKPRDHVSNADSTDVVKKNKKLADQSRRPRHSSASTQASSSGEIRVETEQRPQPGAPRVAEMEQTTNRRLLEV